ncbi:glycosyltransferase [Amycolatopsis sp. K13G38]|uniref:Glycosyltransferase n=1 Tax=Amycolatopsis acididurans TaxID=2724524 RepID=A0ABX1JFD6_9PSEU|nr:bifunctional polysaccharide deacetylase/glycosyltransferase family 2 protein [Amycolatopsis acididurans]NKQ58469.1 glycosyltransferase [Amycolatopsis acididurans]
MKHRVAAPPRAHWLLLCTVLAFTVLLLALNAVVFGSFNDDEIAPTGAAATVPSAISNGGALIDARTSTPVALRPHDKTIALTFDDGPDPQWTPAVLDVLARYQVHATFFETGARAAQHPDLVRQVLADGHEIGNHTMSHPDLRDTGPLRQNLELQATDLALAHAAGVVPSLVRPPYSSSPASLDDAEWQAVRRIGADGRLVVLSDLDSEDWRQPGMGAVVANATPRDGKGAVVLFHDAGGDRSQTVAALERLIPALQAQGWRFDTVSGAVGVTGTDSPADLRTKVAGTVFVFAVRLSQFVAGSLTVLMVAAGVLAIARMIFVLAATAVHVRRRPRKRKPIRGPVTVIVPAYNEEAGIEATISSLLASTHPVEVIVVDDGSTDGTAEIVERLVSSRVRLIKQRNAGKAAALNTGLAAARTELVVMVDGDTVLDAGAVRAIVRPFADPDVGAVSGNAKVANRGGLLGKWQHIEYVIGFNLDRRMYDVGECMPTVPGAVGAFRRRAVLRCGGVPVDTLAEDTDLTMALERAGWRVVYEPTAIAWTEAPATLGQLWKQRYRWCYGTLQAVWKHRRAVLERGTGGRLGRRGLPYLLLFQVLLPVLAPFVDAAAIFGMFTQRWPVLLGYWLFFLVLQVIPGIVAFRLDREPLRPLLYLAAQQVVYRQLMYLVVVQSVVTAVAGARLPWHKLQRRGIGPVPVAQDAEAVTEPIPIPARRGH